MAEAAGQAARGRRNDRRGSECGACPRRFGNARQTAANTVSGIVYENRSRAGTRQANDPGIADILVSNGRDVVRTDSDGRYRLPISDEGLVFVIKPEGFSVPLDSDNLPRFTRSPRAEPSSISFAT